MKPETRALYMKDFAARIDRLPARARDAIRGGNAPLFVQIEDAGWAAWLPAETNVALTDAVYDTLGPRRGDEFFEKLQLGQFDTPTWRNFIQGALAVLGVDPGRLLKWLPRAVGLMFRHCGVWKAEREGETRSKVRIEALPACCVESRHWLSSVRSALTSVYSPTDREGHVELESVDPAARRACYALRWRQKAD